MNNKLYRGIRKGTVPKLYVDEKELTLEAANSIHPSDATVEWSYFGDGPSQTSLAILYDATQNKDISLAYYQQFKQEFIAVADYNLGFTILESQILSWLGKLLSQDDTDGNGWAI